MSSYTHLRYDEKSANKYTDQRERDRISKDLYSRDFYKWNRIEKSKNKEWKETLELENDLRNIVQTKIKDYEETFFQSWVQTIKDYTLTTVDRAIELKQKNKEFMTNEKQPIIRTYIDRLVQWLFRTNFFIKAYPLTKSDEKSAEAVQKFTERCFSSSKAKKALLDMGTTAITNWIWYARTWFETSPEKIKEIKNLESKQKTYYVNDFYAKFERVSEFCLFGEPFQNFYDQRYIIYRKILPIKTILNKIRNLDVKIWEEHIKLIIDHARPCSTKNYDKVRLIKYQEEKILRWMWDDFNYSTENIFDVTFDNDYCEYIEYWTKDNLIIMINWYIVYDWENPLDWRVSPFKYINFTNLPWTWISDGAWSLLRWQQKLYDSLYNISFDLLKFKAGPMFLKQPWVSIEWMEETLKYEPFSFVQVRWPWKLETLEMPAPDMSVSKWMTDILNMSNFAIAPTTYSQTEWVSRSATDSQYRYEWLKDALLVLISSMNHMLTITAKEWILDAKKDMPSKFRLPVLWKDWKVKDWEEVKLEDIKWEFVFEWDSESIRDINKIIERSQLMQFTNFIKTFGQDPITQRWLIDSEKLLEEWISLFNGDTSMILWEKEYYKRLKKAQEKWMEIQEELRKKMAWWQNMSWVWPSNPNPEWEPTQDISSWSNYNSDPNAKQIWEVSEPDTGWVDMASIIKQAME